MLFPAALTNVAALGGGAVVAPTYDLIYVPDLDSDADDLNDFALALQLVRDGSFRPRIVNTTTRTVSVCLARGILDMNGFRTVPVATYQGSSTGVDNSSGYDTEGYRWGQANKPRTTGGWTDTVAGLRQALVNSADGNAVIIWTGTATDVASLLASPADGISGLTGLQLATLKCRAVGGLVGNGGYFQSNGQFFDVTKELAAANAVTASGLDIVWIDCFNGVEALSVAYNGETGIDPIAGAVAAAAAGARPPYSHQGFFYGASPTAMEADTDPDYQLSARGDLVWNASSPWMTWTPNANGKNRYIKLRAGRGTAAQTRSQAKVDAHATARKTELLAGAWATDHCVFEYEAADLSAGSIADRGPYGRNLTTGGSPALVGAGLDLNGSSQYATSAAISDPIGPRSAIFAVVADPNSASLSGTHCLMSRHASAQGWQFRINAGKFEFVHFYNGTATTIQETGTRSTGYALYLAVIDNLTGKLRVNKASVSSAATLPGLMTAALAADVTQIGRRGSGSDYFSGRIAYGACWHVTEEFVPLVEARVYARMAIRGITLP